MRRKLSAIIFAFTICVTISAAPQSSSAQRRQEFAALQPQVKLREIPPEMTRRVQTLHSKLQPSARAWIEQQAKIESKKPAPDVASIAAAARNRFPEFNSLGNLENNNDIQELAFLVLMDATNQSEQDLKDIMAETKAITSAKQKMRDLLAQTKLEIDSNRTLVGATPCQTAFCKSIPVTLGEISNATANSQKPMRIAVPAKLTFADLRTLPGQLQTNLDSMNDLSTNLQLRMQMLMDQRAKFLEMMSNLMKKIDDTKSSILQNIK